MVAKGNIGTWLCDRARPQSSRQAYEHIGPMILTTKEDVESADDFQMLIRLKIDDCSILRDPTKIGKQIRPKRHLKGRLAERLHFLDRSDSV